MVADERNSGKNDGCGEGVMEENKEFSLDEKIEGLRWYLNLPNDSVKRRDEIPEFLFNKDFEGVGFIIRKISPKSEDKNVFESLLSANRDLNSSPQENDSYRVIHDGLFIEKVYKELNKLTIQKNKYKLIIDESESLFNQIQYLKSTALIYFREKDYGTVLEIYNKLNELEPEKYKIHNDLVLLNILTNNTQDAIFHLEKLSKLQNDKTSFDFQIDLDFYHITIPFDRIESILNLVQNSENEEIVLESLSMIFEIRKYKNIREKIFQRLHELKPEDIKYLMNLGIFYHDKRQYKEAIKLFNQVLKISPDNIDVLYSLGEIYYYNREFDKAINYFEKYFSINPESKKGRGCSPLIQIYFYKKEFQKILNLKVEYLFSDLKNFLEPLPVESWEEYIIPLLDCKEIVESFNYGIENIYNYSNRVKYINDTLQPQHYSPSKEDKFYSDLSFKVKLKIFKRAKELNLLHRNQSQKYFTTINELESYLKEFPEDSSSLQKLGQLYKKNDLDEAFNCFSKAYKLGMLKK